MEVAGRSAGLRRAMSPRGYHGADSFPVPGGGGDPDLGMGGTPSASEALPDPSRAGRGALSCADSALGGL
jgi:hypothetical protein